MEEKKIQAEWISVKTRTPSDEQFTRVLVYTEGTDFMGEQFFDINASEFYNFDEDGNRSELVEAVTHWREHDYPLVKGE